MNTLSFPSFASVFFPSLFLMYMFIGYRILVDSFFFQNFESVVPLLSGLCGCSPIATASFFSGHFQDIFPPLIFSSLITICLDVNLFILFGIHWASWVPRSSSFAKFGMFSDFISLNVFLHWAFSLLLLILQ